MILVSLSRFNDCLTWVSYAEGVVIGRTTKGFKGVPAVESTLEQSKMLQEAFKSVKGYLDNPSAPYDLSDNIVIEVSSLALYEWLTERKFTDIYYHSALGCLSLFNELSLPVEVRLVDKGQLWADKYNKPEFITSSQPKVESALDWASQFSE